MSTVPGDRSRKQRRSRIVVNVEETAGPKEKAPPARRRVRRPRARNPRLLVPLGVIALVLLALVAGAYFWWQAYKARPAYALALVLDAARRDDGAAFDALVNVDEVSRGLAPQIAAQMRAPGVVQLPAQVRRQLEANAAVLLPGAREQVRATLMTQIKQVLVQSGTADDSFLVLALGVSRVVEIKPAANDADAERAATATLNVNGRPVEFELRAQEAVAGRPVDTRWQVVQIKSDELAARVAETLARVYPLGK
jgi:hypothetical protein